MAKSLLIVESPAKVRTIKKMLGKDYRVAASLGHVRDLPKKELGVDVKDGFRPHYVTTATRETVAELKKLAASSQEVLLATDPDREGEAICWHLEQLLKRECPQMYRVMR